LARHVLNLVAVVALLLCVATAMVGGDWLVRSGAPPSLKVGILLAAFAALLTLAWYTHDRPRSVVRRLITRMNDGLCPECGYDLRASPDRCPECGTKNLASRQDGKTC
jgi:hypothetical protein